MPKATVNLAVERKELETCPGGFVELRRMTYGKKLDRATQATEQSMKGSPGQVDDEVEMMITLMQRRTAEIEFRECIVNHNLEDDEGNLLDFAKPETLDNLDPRIGEEISTLISELNNYETEMTKPGN